MELNKKLEEAIKEVLKEKKQTDSYEREFIAFINRFISGSGSYDDDDLKDIVNSIKIEENGE